MKPIPRRVFLSSLATAMVTSSSTAFAARAERRRSQGHSTGPTPRGLAEPAFRPLPLGSITPNGWLQRQLRIQADGLTGHLDEFWPDVSDSQWFGGKADGWERAPYWLDGFIPLAWSLDDPKLREKAKRRVDAILQTQRPDGSFGPFPADPNRRYDHWSLLLVNKALVQFHEATGEDRVLRAVLANLKSLNEILDRSPLYDWGKHRWYEGLIPVYYAFEKSRERWLLELAQKLYTQGRDFRALFAEPGMASPTPRRGLWTWDKHVVNAAMALKAYALSWRLTRNREELDFPSEMLAFLDRYHGQATGMFSGDESLSGTSPTQGTELCAVVEAMFSLEQLLAITGSPSWGDRLERIAYNALPATLSPDAWTHQYDQQVNQVQCTINPEAMWSSNGPESNLFGLEPNFGCCTANMHQGWPKFAAHLWMSTPDHGLACVTLAPSTAQFRTRNVPVSVTLETDYPFRETLKFTVRPERAVRFPLQIRVPAWAVHPVLVEPGGKQIALTPDSFHRLDREWKGPTEFEVRLPMGVRATSRYNRALTLERGPLLYSLKIEEQWTRVNADKPHRELPHADFEVRPTSPWNYGLLVDAEHPERSVSFEERPVGDRPFSPDGAGMIARVRGRRLPGWKLRHGWADEIPPEPQKSAEPVEDLTLLPYGCTNLRVTEFPRLQD